MIADYLKRFRKCPGNIVDTEQKDKCTAFIFLGVDIFCSGKYSKPGRVILAFMNVMIKNLKEDRALWDEDKARLYTDFRGTSDP